MENLSLQTVSESLIKTSAVHVKSKELYFTVKMYKEFNLRIYKPLFFIKLSLFFWFAGATGMQAFFPIFLKQRGLSATQMSLAFAASVVFQLLASSLSAVIADKIGRTKPILFVHLILTVTVCLLFIIVPPLKTDDTIPHFELLGHEATYERIVEFWCNGSTLSEQSSCKLKYAMNTKNIFNKTDCFTINNSYENFLLVNNSTNASENVTVCLYEDAKRDSSDFLPTICNEDYCTLLIQECQTKIGKCSFWDVRTTVVFSFYVFLITLHFLSHSCVFRFYDVTGMLLAAEHNGDFGHQRVWASVGSLVGPSLAGYLMQVSYGNKKDYSLAIVLYCVFTLLSALSSWKLEIPDRRPGKRMWRNVLALLKNLDYLVFMMVLLVLGTSFSFRVVYSNWFLEDLGASKLLLGLVIPLSSVFSIVLLFASKWCLLKFGAHNIFMISLVGYGFYNVAFSFLVEPWYSILIGIVAYSLSYNLLWVAVMEFSHVLAPEGLRATVIVSVGLIHYVFSRMTASLVGGLIIDAYGGRVAFRVMGGINIVTVILYGCFRYCRRHIRK